MQLLFLELRPNGSSEPLSSPPTFGAHMNAHIMSPLCGRSWARARCGHFVTSCCCWPRTQFWVVHGRWWKLEGAERQGEPNADQTAVRLRFSPRICRQPRHWPGCHIIASHVCVPHRTRSIVRVLAVNGWAEGIEGVPNGMFTTNVVYREVLLG